MIAVVFYIIIIIIIIIKLCYSIVVLQRTCIGGLGKPISICRKPSNDIKVAVSTHQADCPIAMHV